MVTPSPTQRTLTPADIESLTRASFGDGMRVVDCGPLSGGGFAAVWWVRLGDGRTVVPETSPPAHVKPLRYERDLLAHDRDPAVLDGDWLFMTMLPGQPLAHHAEAAGRMGHEAFDGDGPAHEEFGTMVAELHRITGSGRGVVVRRRVAEDMGDCLRPEGEPDERSVQRKQDRFDGRLVKGGRAAR